MKYYELIFSVKPLNSDACDLLAAMAGEAGLESFEETSEGLKGYVQQQLFDQAALDALLQSFPFPGVTVSYTVSEAEDRDWNEQWEQEGFEPIIIDDRLVIHDGRHLPNQFSILNSQFSIEIDAHLAFGTGTHETTQMVCSTLLDLLSSPYGGDRGGLSPRVLDCGCGTGILGIVAMKLGARECVAYDNDEWSVDNTRHNAVINHVVITPLHGDASILNNVEGTFDIVVANINRNILLSDMPMFRQKMASGARLILSGFYTADIPILTDCAAKLGLTLSHQQESNGWACIVLTNN
jgi:ribosomal protein L11 methyltransferase